MLSSCLFIRVHLRGLNNVHNSIVLGQCKLMFALSSTQATQQLGQVVRLIYTKSFHVSSTVWKNARKWLGLHKQQVLAWAFRNNIYKERFIKVLQPDEYTDIIQAHKVLTKGSSAKEQYELCCKTLTTIIVVPLIGMLLACLCHTAILDAQFAH